MSASITPLYSMNVATGEALMAQIAHQLSEMQVNKVQTKQRYSDWRSLTAEEPAPAYAHGNDMMATSLVTVLLDCLFGGGLFSSLGGMGEMLHGAAQIGGMDAATRPSHKPNPMMEQNAKLNEALNKAAYQQAMNGQNTQTKMLQQMIAMLLMNMLSNNQTETGEGKSGGSKGQSVKSDMIADPLRHPAMAQLKQNRQSICCIRTMFQRSADIITPKFGTLKYAM